MAEQARPARAGVDQENWGRPRRDVLEGRVPGARRARGMVVLLAGCEGVELPADGNRVRRRPAVSSGAVGPLDNPDGTKAGLAAITADRQNQGARPDRVETGAAAEQATTGTSSATPGWTPRPAASPSPATAATPTTTSSRGRRGRPLPFWFELRRRLHDPGRPLHHRRGRSARCKSRCHGGADRPCDAAVRTTGRWVPLAWDKGKRRDIANVKSNLIHVDGHDQRLQKRLRTRVLAAPEQADPLLGT